MRIDHEQNPLAIIRRYKIPYGNDLYLEGQIRAITEDGFDEVNWFEGEVRYSKHNCEVGGVQFDRFYQTLKRGAENIGEVEEKLRIWCNLMCLGIADVIVETAGVNL